MHLMRSKDREVRYELLLDHSLSLLYVNQDQNKTSSKYFHTIQKRTISLLNCLAPPIRLRLASRLIIAAINAGPKNKIIIISTK